ncbi:MAG TPA: hypothetical protein VFB31_03240 [Pseudolabrys sp.]|nr:hypothetical protein [Pseudolabrys sp.]
MDGDVSSDDIARIEERIEQLHEQVARCRKLSFAAKLLIAAGGVWLLLTLLWLVPYLPSLTFGALAAAIGGIVLLGSNSTTWSELEAALAASQAMRDEWIGQKDMRLIGGQRTLH